MKGYFGVYWTFPVPWVGLTGFHDVEHAARISRTIRYQREVIRRFATFERGTVEAEAAFMEQAPDRGTPEVAAEIAQTVNKRPDLTPVLVDFAEVLGWRRHYELKKRMEAARAVFLLPEELMMDGQSFDPKQHFRDWAERWSTHAATKDDHRATILAAVKDASPPLAAHLNQLGLRTHTGKEWTSDNLRKFLKG